ncbi:hypothetical protein MHU86_1114 [Fragilaria crotonensis]|nr:hypothetical protein MHU86_1114 [Fragilaria crotonensis]
MAPGMPQDPPTSTRRAPPTHKYGTRAKSQQPLHHVAAPANALLLAAAITAATTPRPDAVYCAFHGNAFNPDTGKSAEYYQELSQCSSDGPLRQDSNADDIGPLVAQEFGNIKQGSNSIFFTPVSAIPAGRKATYICVVSAFHPKKANPRRVHWTVGGDKVDDDPFDIYTKTAH